MKDHRVSPICFSFEIINDSEAEQTTYQSQGSQGSGTPVGGGLADGVPLPKSVSQRANLLKVKWDPIEADKHLTLVF